MKKVIWISDFNLAHTFGGAQRSNDLIISKGRELGFDIFEANYNHNFKITNFDEYDILISSNLEAIYKSNPDIIDKISKHKNHVRLEHDLNRYLKPEDRVKLFGSCKKTILLTDFHHKLFLNNYGDIFKNVEIIADPIDTKIFNNKNMEREKKILYVGFMHELKGTLSFFDFVFSHPEDEFVVAGWGTPVFDFLAKNAPNVKFLGPVRYEQMPLIYNQYETLFYSPVLPEPFCRSVAEGIFCGIKLMSFNPSIIGCVEELNRLGNKDFKYACENAADIFWQKINE